MTLNEQIGVVLMHEAILGEDKYLRPHEIAARCERALDEAFSTALGECVENGGAAVRSMRAHPWTYRLSRRALILLAKRQAQTYTVAAR